MRLYNDDCLNIMPTFPAKSIDMILCDLPYGRTHNRWDSVIPLDTLWENYKRIIKDDGAILLFADGLFMAELMMSNPKIWKYNLVWNKVLPSGFLNANRQPLRQHEEIVVFYKKQPVYNPQKTEGAMNHSKGVKKELGNNNYNDFDFVDNREKLGNMKHPKSILEFSKPHPSISVHPTQKPVELLRWLIRSYSNEGDTILDNCMGCGSTGFACIEENRNFIGIEKDTTYFKIAQEQILRRINKYD